MKYISKSMLAYFAFAVTTVSLMSSPTMAEDAKPREIERNWDVSRNNIDIIAMSRTDVERLRPHLEEFIKLNNHTGYAGILVWDNACLGSAKACAEYKNSTK